MPVCNDALDSMAEKTEGASSALLASLPSAFDDCEVQKGSVLTATEVDRVSSPALSMSTSVVASSDYPDSMGFDTDIGASDWGYSHSDTLYSDNISWDISSFTHDVSFRNDSEVDLMAGSSFLSFTEMLNSPDVPHELYSGYIHSTLSSGPTPYVAPMFNFGDGFQHASAIPSAAIFPQPVLLATSGAPPPAVPFSLSTVTTQPSTIHPHSIPAVTGSKQPSVTFLAVNSQHPAVSHQSVPVLPSTAA